MLLPLETTEEEDLLRFILDTTIELWRDNEPAVLDFVTRDPMCKDLDTLLLTTGTISGMIPMAERIRARLDERVTA